MHEVHRSFKNLTMLRGIVSMTHGEVIAMARVGIISQRSKTENLRNYIRAKRHTI